MKTCRLDAGHATPEAVYAALQCDLGLPAHFGRNLDALWDSLTGDLEGPVEIIWRDHAAARRHLGADTFDRLVATLRQVERERTDFRLILK